MDIKRRGNDFTRNDHEHYTPKLMPGEHQNKLDYGYRVSFDRHNSIPINRRMRNQGRTECVCDPVKRLQIASLITVHMCHFYSPKPSVAYIRQ